MKIHSYAKKSTDLCGCGVVIKEHPRCQACRALVCSEFTYNDLIRYKGVDLCPYCYNFWHKLEESRGQISAEKFLTQWGISKEYKFWK